jgi:hypothetical protein
MGRWVIVAVLVGVPACHLIVSFDDPVVVPDAAQPLPTEACEDGIDNDGDGLVDCADPSCQPDHECIPEPPGGFTLEYVGSNPTCPDGAAPRVVLTQDTPACDLSSCGCGSPNGACGINATFFSTACMGGTGSNVTMSGNTCYNSFGTALGGTFIASAAAVSCTATGTATTTAPPPPRALNLCTVSASGGCTAGQRCVRRTGDSPACAVAQGAMACPSEYPVSRTAGDSIDDQRQCGCGCSSAASCAGAQVQYYGSGGCNGMPKTVTASTTCQVLQSQASSARVSNGGAPTGCLPSAKLDGVLTVMNQLTMCCRP